MIEINVRGNAREFFTNLDRTALRVDNTIQRLQGNLNALRDVNVNVNSSGIRELNQDLRRVNGNTNRTNIRFGELSRTLLGFEAFRFISEQTRVIIKDFRELEDGIAGIKKTTNLTGSNLRDLTDELTNLSITQNSMDITALHKIAESAGQLGITGKDNIIEFTKVIRELSATSKLTAEQAGTEFAKLSLTLGEPIKEVKRLASTFTLLASTTTTDEKKLVNYTQRLAGMGKTFGLTTQQIVGMSATLADIGVGARLGTTAMSRLMTKLLTQTRLVTDTLKLDFDSFSEALRNKPIQAINLVLNRLGQLDKQNVAEALREMHLSSVGATQTLIKLSRAMGKLNTNIATSNKAFRENVALDREFKTVQDTLTGATERYTSSVKNMNYQLGKLFKPIVISAQNLLSGLANSIAKTAKNLDWLINSEKYTKEYMSKTNVAIRKQAKNLKHLTEAQNKEKNIKSAIIKLSQEYNSVLDKNSRKAKALEGALASLGKEYNKTTLKVKELQRVAGKTITQRVNIKVGKIPKYEIRHRVPQVEVVNSKYATYNKTQRAVQKPTIEHKRVEKAQKTNIQYKRELKAKDNITKKHNAIELKRAKIKYKVLAKTYKRDNDLYISYRGEINDYILKATNHELALEIKQIKAQYREYRKAGIERLKLEKWYSLKLIEVKQKEAKRLLEIEKDKAKKLKALHDIKDTKSGNDILRLKVILDKVGLFRQLSTTLSDAGNDFAKNIGESLRRESVTKGLKDNILNIANSLAYGNTSNDSKNEKYGKVAGGGIGATIGGIYGGVAGAKIGETIGVTLGGSIGRGWKKYITGKKSEWIKFNDDALKDFSKTSAHLFSSTKYKENTKLTKEITIKFKAISDSYNNFYSQLGLSTKNFYHELAGLGKFKTKDLQTNLDKAFIRGLSPTLDDTELTAIYNSWKQYTKDTKKSVSEAIIEELQRVTNTKQDIASYLANKAGDVQKVFEIKTLKDLSIIGSLGKQLNVNSIEDYNSKLQEAIKQGEVLTKDEIKKWDLLGKALLDYNKQFDSYKQSLLDERNKLRELIRTRKEGNNSIASTNKELLSFSSSLNGIVANKNKDRKVRDFNNASFSDRENLNTLREQFVSYSDKNSNSIIGIIDTAIARNKAYNAGLNTVSNKLSYADKRQLESLSKLEERLANIEKLLSEQGDNIEATARNTKELVI